jgi:hypothetical protein
MISGLNVLSLIFPLLASAVPLQDESQAVGGGLAPRQWPVPINDDCGARFTKMKGDGEPMQFYLYTQITVSRWKT